MNLMSRMASGPADFAARLLNSHDKSADSVVFSGLVALFTLCGSLIWDIWRNGHPLNATDFGGGCAAIIGAIGIAKGWRDRLTPVGNPPVIPEKASETIAAAAAADASSQ